MAVPRFDYFNYGRKEAGMGWYKPGPPGWLQIAGPILNQAIKLAGQYGSSKIAQNQQQSLTDQLNAGGQVQTPEVLGSTDLPPGTTRGSSGTPDILSGRTPAMPDPNDPMGEKMIPAGPYSPTVGPEGANLNVTRNPYLTPEEFQKLQRQRMFLQLMQQQIWSSRALKDNIERANERRSLNEVMATPVYRYRYVDEPVGSQGRLGPMAEEVPARWQTPDGHGIKMPVYLGALHAATRALARDVRSLKDSLRG